MRLPTSIKALVSTSACLLFLTGASRAETLQFDVYRNGSPLGTHTVTLQQQGDHLQVDSKVRFKVRVGPIVAYQYRSDCSETWKKDELEQLICTTTKNKKTHTVNVSRSGANLAISVDGHAAKIVPDVVPVSPWNMFALGEDKTLAVEDGSILPLTVTDYGKDIVNLSGKNLDARKVRYTSKLVVDSWYDAKGRWLKANFKARGQNIEYRAKL